jgi:DUF1680 family protein
MTTSARRPALAPATPTALRPLPLGAVRLTGGSWAARQRTNAAVSLAAGARALRAAGNDANFAVVAGRTGGAHRHRGAADGDVRNFVDSDVYKWLEAVAWASEHPGVAGDVQTFADELIDLVETAQDDDGYLNTWYQTQDRSARFSNLQYGHEMYCLGHLIQAGIAWSRARDDDRLLTVARRFADLVVDRFGPGGQEAVCGHPEVEMALVELTRETGDPRYAALALAFVDRRGHGVLGPGRFGAAYYQDRVPYREAEDLEGHAVRALYLGCGAVDAAVEAHDDDLLDASWRLWRAMVAQKMYLTGGVGSRHHGESLGEPFELPPDRAYCETCAAIGVVMWSWRLLLTRRDGFIADVIERTVHNALLAGVSLDGAAFHYVNPLDVPSTHPRESWFEIACCPPNVMRALASLDQLVATGDATAVQIHQYVPAEIAVPGGIRLRLDTAYPADGRITVRVVACPGAPWSLELRLPGWHTTPPDLTVNGGDVSGAVDENGYVVLTREWAAGDVVELRLDLEVRLTAADPRIGALRSAVAVERGPLVYCVEEADLPDGTDLATLVLDAAKARFEVTDGLAPDLPTLRTWALAAEDPRCSAPWPYSPRHADERWPSMSIADARLVPYATWGNRGSGAMRTWLRVVADQA